MYRKPISTKNKVVQENSEEPVEQGNAPVDLRRGLLVIGVNLLILTELCIGMYRASNTPDDFTATFMKTFFGLLVPTLIGFFLVKRRLRPEIRDE